MSREIYRYEFSNDACIEDVESSLLLAILATENIHGESQTRLDVSHFLDAEKRTCVIDAATLVGQDLNRLFVGFINREFGADSFKVTRVTDTNESQETAA